MTIPEKCPCCGRWTLSEQNLREEKAKLKAERDELKRQLAIVGIYLDLKQEQA